MTGKGKRRGTLWKQISVAAACLVLVTAVVVTIPLGVSDHSENVTTSGDSVFDIPVYEDAFYSASDIAEVFSGPAIEGPTNRYSTVCVPDAEYLTLNALPEEEYLPIYQYGADGKASDESELISFAEVRLDRFAESLGMELPAFKISTDVALSYEPVDDSEMAYWLNAYQHERYNYIFARSQETDRTMFLDGEQITVRQKQSDGAIIESLASVKEKLFAVFGVSFTDVKVVRGFDAYSLHGVEYLAVYFYNAADHPLNEYAGKRQPYSDYISLYFDNHPNYEGDFVSDDLLTQVEVRFCESRVELTEAQAVASKAKILPLERAEEMLAAGYVFGGHACALCMEAQDKVDFAAYDYVSFEYVIRQPYGQQVSKGFPFYAFYKQIGTAENGNIYYAKTYVPAIEVTGLADYFESQAENHREEFWQ